MVVYKNEETVAIREETSFEFRSEAPRIIPLFVVRNIGGDYCSIKHRRKSRARCPGYLLEILLPLRNRDVPLTSDVRRRLQERSFLPRTSSFVLFYFIFFAHFETEGNSVNCEFMSVDHDGHLSLQFALYQSSFRFLCAEPPPQLFRCSFESMSLISAPGSESSSEIASRFAELYTSPGYCLRGISRFPATANSTSFLGRR